MGKNYNINNKSDIQNLAKDFTNQALNQARNISKNQLSAKSFDVQCPYCSNRISAPPGKSTCPVCGKTITLNLEFNF